MVGHGDRRKQASLKLTNLLVSVNSLGFDTSFSVIAVEDKINSRICFCI